MHAWLCRIFGIDLASEALTKAASLRSSLESLVAMHACAQDREEGNRKAQDLRTYTARCSRKERIHTFVVNVVTTLQVQLRIRSTYVKYCTQVECLRSTVLYVLSKWRLGRCNAANHGCMQKHKHQND